MNHKEVNATIAKHLFGWSEGRLKLESKMIPEYTTDIAAAMMALDRLRSMVLMVDILLDDQVCVAINMIDKDHNHLSFGSISKLPNTSKATADAITQAIIKTLVARGDISQTSGPK